MPSLKHILEQTEINCLFVDKYSQHLINEKFGPRYSNAMLYESMQQCIVYTNTCSPIVLAHLGYHSSTEKYVNLHIDIKRSLMHFSEVTFNYILFVLTLYNSFDEVDPIRLLENSQKFSHLPAFDDLLSPTFGYILYKHQLEQIIARVSNYDTIDAQVFRKKWNIKSHEIRELFTHLMVSDSQNLYSFLQERTVEANHFVVSPNYRGAQLLYHYLLHQAGVL